jgi:hypothetical protein
MDSRFELPVPREPIARMPTPELVILITMWIEVARTRVPVSFLPMRIWIRVLQLALRIISVGSHILTHRMTFISLQIQFMPKDEVGCALRETLP